MKKRLTEYLHASRPTISQSDRRLLWERIEPSLSPSQFNSPYFRWVFEIRYARVIALIALVVLIGGGATTAFAGHARPGDFLFPVDRALERLELKLARTEEKRAEVGVRHAEERLAELKDLVEKKKETVPSENASPTPAPEVSAAVDALVRVMDESNMSTVARERVYTNLFQEIDPLSVKVQIDTHISTTSPKGKVEVTTKNESSTKIEIRESDKRTRIEKKEGRVHIEYESTSDVRVKNNIRVNTDKKDRE